MNRPTDTNRPTEEFTPHPQGSETFRSHSVANPEGAAARAQPGTFRPHTVAAEAEQSREPGSYRPQTAAAATETKGDRLSFTDQFVNFSPDVAKQTLAGGDEKIMIIDGVPTLVKVVEVNGKMKVMRVVDRIAENIVNELDSQGLMPDTESENETGVLRPKTGAQRVTDTIRNRLRELRGRAGALAEGQDTTEFAHRAIDSLAMSLANMVEIFQRNPQELLGECRDGRRIVFPDEMSRDLATLAMRTAGGSWLEISEFVRFKGEPE